MSAISIEAMHEAADQASDLLKALASRHRLLILCHLAEGRCSVGELASVLALRDSTVSQHLALLRRDGLVIAEREGQTIWYSLASGPTRKILETLFSIYCPTEPPKRARARPPAAPA
jgi:DNA-binding transcriptional ArsR family regulator